MTFSTTVAARQPQDIRTTESTPSSRVGRFAAAVRMAFATLAIVATVAVAGTGTAAAGRERTPDPIADQAALGLSLWRQYEVSADASVLASYTSQRDAVAASVAARLMIDPSTLQHVWAAADAEHQEALLAGLTQLGVPYRRNTSKEGEGFDCSGLTTYAWGQAGFTLARQSSTQIRQAAPRTFETAQAGDLVQYPGHVMMWLGVGKSILHSPYSGRNVEVVTLSSKRSLKVGDPTGA